MLNSLLILFLALILDLILGDPQTRFHPVRGMAAINTFYEKIFRKHLAHKLKIAGFCTQISALATICSLAYILLLISNFHPLSQAFLLYISISPRDLHQHIKRIANALQDKKLSLARQHTAMIVRRDTQKLTESELSRAALESVSENSVDGTTAAIFFFCLFGPLGAIFYRAANTLDSMFGYKNKKYLDFGYSSAKLDDILNFIPARLTGFCICLSAFILKFNHQKALQIMLRDGRKSSSPNSAITESALAGALCIKLGGTSTENGIKVTQPTLGDGRPELNFKDIYDGIKIVYLSMAIFTLLTALLLL